MTKDYWAKLEVYDADKLTEEDRYAVCNWLRKLSNDIGKRKEKYTTKFTAKLMK